MLTAIASGYGVVEVSDVPLPDLSGVYRRDGQETPFRVAQWSPWTRTTGSISVDLGKGQRVRWVYNLKAPPRLWS